VEINHLSNIHITYGHTHFIVEMEEHRGSGLLPILSVALSSGRGAFSFCPSFFNHLNPLREAALAPEQGGEGKLGVSVDVPLPLCAGLCLPHVGPTRPLGRTSAPVRAESSCLQQKQMLEWKEEHCLFMVPWGRGEED